MHQQDKTNQPQPPYKLSGNNSLLTLPGGERYELNIEYALLNLLEGLPPEVHLEEIRTEILGIQDELMDLVPNDFSMKRFKVMHNQLTAYSSFFHALFLMKGGSND